MEGQYHVEGGCVYSQDDVGNVQPYWTQLEFSEMLNAVEPRTAGANTSSATSKEDTMNDAFASNMKGLPGKESSRLRRMIIASGSMELAAEYTAWYEEGGAALHGTPKWAAGEDLYRRAEVVVTVNTEEESTMDRNRKDAGATSVELEVIDVELSPTGELRDTGEVDVEEERRNVELHSMWGGAPSKRVWFALQTYGKLHDAIEDAMERIPTVEQEEDLTIQGILNDYNRLWCNRAGAPTWGSLMDRTGRFITEHPTDVERAALRKDDRRERRKDTLNSVTSTLKGGLGTLIDIVGGSIERVADATVDLSAQLTERAGRDMGKVISSAMIGASAGATLVQDTHMELYIQRHGEEGRRNLRGAYDALRGEVQVAKFQRKVIGKAARKAISIQAATDAVGVEVL